MSETWLIFFAAVAANSAGNLFAKIFSQKMEGGSLGVYLSPWFLAGASLFGLGFALYCKALTGLALNVAYPMLVGTSVLIVMVASAGLFSERMSITAAVGAVLVVTGVTLLVRSA